MSMIITILAAIFAIFCVILIHELGHFIVARCCGVKILKFSIGFGKAIWSRKAKNGTEYAIAILPLGGYVKMLGENEPSISPEDRPHAFDQKPLLKRMAITLAGPFANFILAIFVFGVIYMIGIETIKPVIGNIVPNSIAAKAGLQKGDEIIAMDDKKISSWQQSFLVFIKHMGSKDHINLLVQKPSGITAQKTLTLNDWHVNQEKMDILPSLGIIPFIPKILPKVDEVAAKSPASLVDLRKDDLIIAVNGQAVNDWQSLLQRVQKIPGEKINLLIKREGINKQVEITVGEKVIADKKIGYLGIAPKIPQWPANMRGLTRYNIFTAWWPALQQTAMLIFLNALVLGKMFSGKISMQALSGPITIFQTAGKASQIGVSAYLTFIGFISATLGFVNLLPIPPLDGGHFLFQIIEGIIGRPVPQRYQLFILKMGVLLLIFLFLQAIYNDVFRLFRGL